MVCLSMKKILNTIYITKKCFLHKEGETIVVKQGNTRLAQYPGLSIGGIACFGKVQISPQLMAFCSEKGIGIAYYSPYGRYQAMIVGKVNGNVLLRREQYRWADDPKKIVSLSKVFVAAKIYNSRSILQREIRNYGNCGEIEKAIVDMDRQRKRLKTLESYDMILGVEGDAAKTYFSVFHYLIKEKGFQFRMRTRHPPTDAVNALLSFVYSLITQECVAGLYGVGLDPFVGFLHRDRPGRVSLALDLIEEFRSYWADRFVLSLINRKQIKASDFIIEASGAVLLKDPARKKLLVAYQDKKQEVILHPFFNEKMMIGLLPHSQAQLLARFIRGDMECYTPFLVK